MNNFKAIGLKEIHASASSVLKQDDTLFSKYQTFSDPIKIKAIFDAL